MKRNLPRREASSDPRRVAPELSRLVDITRIGHLAHRLTISASEAERRALAERFDLVSLDRLEADLILKKRGDGIVALSGRFRARVAQRCIVTLEPVQSDIDEPVELYFGTPSGVANGTAPDPFNDEAFPEPLIDGSIDCGEAVAQALALSLDPYPRTPDAG